MSEAGEGRRFNLGERRSLGLGRDLGLGGGVGSRFDFLSVVLLVHLVLLVFGTDLRLGCVFFLLCFGLS